MGATAYFLALRVVYLYTLPVDGRLAAMRFDSGGFNTAERVTAGLRHLGTILLGPERAGFNLPALLCWSIAAASVFKGAQRVFDKTVAFRALLLFAALPVFFFSGAIFSTASVMIAAWAAALWLMTFTLRRHLWLGRNLLRGSCSRYCGRREDGSSSASRLRRLRCGALTPPIPIRGMAARTGDASLA